MNETHSPKTPKISIVCPIRNVAPYIAETIDSVVRQTYTDWELLIMDGASKDGTLAIVEEYTRKHPNIFLHSEPDESPWEATDRGIDRARGEFLVIIAGQDGFLDPTWLEQCANAFAKDPEIALVWGLSRGMLEDGTLVDEREVAYSQFAQPESRRDAVVLMTQKVGRVAKDLVIGNRERKKAILKNLFSPTARTRMAVLTQRSFPGGVIPQKQAWLSYWMKTGFVFPDQAMCVNKAVYVSCAPRYPKGSRMVNHMTDFNFNFNTRGYLSYCIPVFAMFGRRHPGNSAERVPGELRGETEKYLKKVIEFRKEVTRGKQQVHFVDRNGKPLAESHTSHTSRT